MKKIGFLSFGHWNPSPQSGTRSAGDALLQSIDLAVAAEELGADGAYFRVHHFARQLGSPFPLLAAVGARTKTIEIGTAVIDMRYENPLYMAEDAGAADLISGGRLQLGISRGSPEQVIDGWRYFGYAPPEGQTEADMARRHAEVFLDVLEGKGFAPAQPAADVPQPARPAPARAAFRRLARAHLVGCRDRRNRPLGGEARHEPAELDAEVRRERQAVPHPAGRADPRPIARPGRRPAMHTRPRVSVSRSIFALVNDMDRAYFGRGQSDDHFGYIEPEKRAVFGRSYAAEPDVLIDELKGDEAIAEADTLLLTVPNQLGVAYNAHVIEMILKHVAPGLGWR
jgi:alkanesulfonate monooxygenase SsuD/methylene tetrahydromethanopterin reductase-like flavin-dependent oxidoreductase (luciferase family)